MHLQCWSSTDCLVVKYLDLRWPKQPVYGEFFQNSERADIKLAQHPKAPHLPPVPPKEPHLVPPPLDSRQSIINVSLPLLSPPPFECPVSLRLILGFPGTVSIVRSPFFPFSDTCTTEPPIERRFLVRDLRLQLTTPLLS